MKLTSKVVVCDDTGRFFESVKSEQKNMLRSSLKIKQSNQKVVFEIKADDASALRATLNTVLKLLLVYEKMLKIK